MTDDSAQYRRMEESAVKERRVRLWLGHVSLAFYDTALFGRNEGDVQARLDHGRQRR